MLLVIPLQSLGQGIQTSHCKRLQINHLHRNHLDKVWPERCVEFTVNWQDQQQVLLMTLVFWTNQQLPELVFLISFVRNAEPVIRLSINLTYFKLVNTHSCHSTQLKITMKQCNMTQSDIPIFESIQLFNKTLRSNILSNVQCYISHIHLVINTSIYIKMICRDNSESLSDAWEVCTNWCASWRATKLSITGLKQDALWHIQNAAQPKGEAFKHN